MDALVTGGAGFIGSTLVDRLLGDGHSVDAIDDLSTGSLSNLCEAKLHERFRFFQVDIRNPKLVQLISDRRPEVIFHLAAQSSVSSSVEDPALDAEINILGTLRVLDAARAAQVRKVVFAASGGTIYGSAELADLPLLEGHPQGPTSPYGISKRAAVDYLRTYRELYGLEFTALALANVYGPRQDPYGEAGVVAAFSKNLVSERPSTINGDGEQTRDFVFVDDVVSAFCQAAAQGDGLLVNIGSGEQTSVNLLYETMAQANGGGLPAQHGPARNGEVRFSALDPRLAGEALSWKPTIPLSEGVSRVLDAAAKRLSNPLG